MSTELIESTGEQVQELNQETNSQISILQNILRKGANLQRPCTYDKFVNALYSSNTSPTSVTVDSRSIYGFKSRRVVSFTPETIRQIMLNGKSNSSTEHDSVTEGYVTTYTESDDLENLQSQIKLYVSSFPLDWIKFQYRELNVLSINELKLLGTDNISKLFEGIFEELPDETFMSSCTEYLSIAYYVHEFIKIELERNGISELEIMTESQLVNKYFMDLLFLSLETSHEKYNELFASFTDLCKYVHTKYSPSKWVTMWILPSDTKLSKDEESNALIQTCHEKWNGVYISLISNRNLQTTRTIGKLSGLFEQPTDLIDKSELQTYMELFNHVCKQNQKDSIDNVVSAISTKIGNEINESYTK
jgi:hypothetical protein